MLILECLRRIREIIMRGKSRSPRRRIYATDTFKTKIPHGPPWDWYRIFVAEAGG
jgi:hypothetical protein